MFGAFGGNHHYAVGCSRTVEGGSRRAFQYSDRFYVVRVDVIGTVTEVDSVTGVDYAVAEVIGKTGVVGHGHTVDDVQRLVAGERRVTTHNYFLRTSGGSGTGDIHTGYLTRKSRHHRTGFGGYEVVALYRRGCITQYLLASFDT